MQAFLISTGIVALAEMGDKTQLLALVLAARFKRPVIILAAILLATILNHGLAGALAVWITSVAQTSWLQIGLGLSFIVMAGWVLVPDKLDDQSSLTSSRLGVFGTTFILFFLAEMGDKTQIATVALAAHYEPAWLVVLGTTLGMLIANAPAVVVGERLLSRLPMSKLRWIASGLFLVLGVWTLVAALD